MWTVPPRARGLVADQLGPAQTFAPVDGQRAVGRPGHRILGDADIGAEDPAHAVDPVPVTRGGDDDGPATEGGQLGQVGLEAADGVGVGQLDEDVEPTTAEPLDSRRW